ncbi:MAG: choice-of-anchor B family protein [Bacteroidota bacterium]
MKKIIFLFIGFICLSNNIKAQAYPSLNINLLSHLDPETDLTGSDGRKYSGCWGWYQVSNNKEYAIVCTSSQTYFIDVTNPAQPTIRDSVKGAKNGCTWREVKTYQNYCYVASDDPPPNAFQIIDMQYLPDSVHVVHNGTTYFERSHTLFIDHHRMYCGAPKDVGTGYQSPMRVYSLANPEAPVLLRRLEDDINSTLIDYVHDMFVRNDTIYASTGWKGLQVLVFDTVSNTFSLKHSFDGYEYDGYNHSSWQTDDRKTMVFADEVPTGLPAKVLDVSNLNNINVVDMFKSHTGATAHNPYIIGNNWCWMSTYQDGLYLYDISTPAITSIYGFFDTHPQHGTNDNFSTNAYRGNWGAYPFLPSRIIIACDMQNGIFILEGDENYKLNVGLNEKPSGSSLFSMFPNPASDQLFFAVANQQSKKINYTITDVTGKVVETNSLNIESALYRTSIQTSHLTGGCYFVTLTGDHINETKKIIIQH